MCYKTHSSHDVTVSTSSAGKCSHLSKWGRMQRTLTRWAVHPLSSNQHWTPSAFPTLQLLPLTVWFIFSRLLIYIESVGHFSPSSVLPQSPPFSNFCSKQSAVSRHYLPTHLLSPPVRIQVSLQPLGGRMLSPVTYISRAAEASSHSGFLGFLFVCFFDLMPLLKLP